MVLLKLDSFLESESNWKYLRNLNKHEIIDVFCNLSEFFEQHEKDVGKKKFSNEKGEAEDRYVELVNMVLDLGLDKVLLNTHNSVYDFLDNYENIENPFYLDEKQFGNTLKVNDADTLIETKCKVCTLENRMAKVCIAQMMRNVREAEKNDGELELRNRLTAYTHLSDYLHKPEVSEQINVKDFLEEVRKYRKFGNNVEVEKLDKSEKKEIKANYAKLKEYEKVLKNIWQDNADIWQRPKCKNMKLDIINFGQFAISKNLKTKLYEYKNMDIISIVKEYDLLRDTKESEDVGIYRNIDDKKIPTISVCIKGYSQPYSVHLNECVQGDLNKLYYKIPVYSLVPPIKMSVVTFNMDSDRWNAVDHLDDVYANSKCYELKKYMDKISDIKTIKKIEKEANMESYKTAPDKNTMQKQQTEPIKMNEVESIENDEAELDRTSNAEYSKVEKVEMIVEQIVEFQKEKAELDNRNKQLNVQINEFKNSNERGIADSL